MKDVTPPAGDPGRIVVHRLRAAKDPREAYAEQIAARFQPDREPGF